MGIKNSKNTITAQPFFASLLKGIALIILIFTRTENIYGKTSIIGFDLIAECLPKNILYYQMQVSKDIKIKKDPYLFYLFFSKNIYLKYKGKRITIKLFSREISYRASYNYKRENFTLHYIRVNNFKITERLKLTHEHVYDLLSISYGSKKYRINKSKKYKINEADIECYHYFNIGFSINFPGEFYKEYMLIPQINVKSIRDFFTPPHNEKTVSNFGKKTYEYFFFVETPERVKYIKGYYSVIFNSTNINQWISNIAIGLLENIFIEYTIEIPIRTWLSLYLLHIHISIGTIIGTIECLYKHIKKDDDNKNIKNNYDISLLKSFYFLFLLNSMCVFKISLS